MKTNNFYEANINSIINEFAYIKSYLNRIEKDEEAINLCCKFNVLLQIIDDNIFYTDLQHYQDRIIIIKKIFNQHIDMFLICEYKEYYKDIISELENRYKEYFEELSELINQKVSILKNNLHHIAHNNISMSEYIISYFNSLADNGILYKDDLVKLNREYYYSILGALDIGVLNMINELENMDDDDFFEWEDDSAFSSIKNTGKRTIVFFSRKKMLELYNDFQQKYNLKDIAV